MSLKDRNIVVTGGSRGLGLGLVEALVARGSKVTVVARSADALEAVRARLGVDAISADVTDEAAARHIVATVRPDILVLNAGAKPRMGPLDQLSWADFTAPWEHDVKAGLYWLQAALNMPLAPGSRVLVVSSGAAVSGSPRSGGYGGLRALLADDVKLRQSARPLRVGRADVGAFFSAYAELDDVRLAAARLEGREVIAVFENRADPKPDYVMWLEWRDGRVSFIRDCRYVRYVVADAELTLAPSAAPEVDD